MNWIAENAGHLISSVSVLVALLTWLYTTHKTAHAERIRHTAEAIAHLSTADRLAEASFQMSLRIESGEELILAELDEESERPIVDLLSYYEYLCELHSKNVFDENVIIHLRGGHMKKTLKLCRNFITDRRMKQGRKELYLKFEQFGDDQLSCNEI